MHRNYMCLYHIKRDWLVETRCDAAHLHESSNHLLLHRRNIKFNTRVLDIQVVIVNAYRLWL